MAKVTLEQLMTLVPIEQARKTMIGLLVAVGFKGAASWQEGSYGRTLGIELPALLMSDLSLGYVNIAKGGYSDTAEAGWLTLYSDSAYDNQRSDPVRTQGWVVLTATADATPYPLAAGDLVVADRLGRTYRNIASVTVVPGDDTPVQVEADVSGEAGNVSADTITILQTALAGVTVSNPGVWITRYGADEEGDSELRLRNRTKWATRAYTQPGEAYINWALQTDPVITRAEINGQNIDGPGWVRIYIAGGEGTLDPVLGTKVENFICNTGAVGEGKDGILRKPLGAKVRCVPATARIVTVSGTLYVAAAYQSSAPALVEAALKSFFRELPIGGVVVSSGDPGRVLRSALYGVIMRVPGVINANLTAPTDDTELEEGEVAVLVTAFGPPVVV